MSDTHLTYAQYQTYHARKSVAHQYWSLLLRVRKMFPTFETAMRVHNLDATCCILKRMRNGKLQKNDLSILPLLLKNSPVYDGLLMHRQENEKQALVKLLASRRNLIELCSE